MDDPDSWFWTIIDGQEFYFADGDNLVEPLELGLQTWENGHLKSILCGAYVYCQLSGPLPENINELTAIEDLRFEGNYLSDLIPETICQLNLDYWLLKTCFAQIMQLIALMLQKVEFL